MKSYKLFILHLILLVCLTCACQEPPKTVKIHMTIDNWNSWGGKCHIFKTYIFEVSQSSYLSFQKDILSPRDSLFQFITINNDSTVLIRKSENLYVQGMNIDTDYVSIGFKDTGFGTHSYDAGTTFYLRIDTSTNFYKLNKSKYYPIITDVTEQDDILSQIIKRDEIDECTNKRTKWTELYDKNNCLVKDGLYQTWNSDGFLVYQVHYDSGKVNGLVQSWDDNGKLSSEGMSLNNRSVGVWKNWYKNGQLKSRETFQDSSRSREITSWYEDGTIKEKGVYNANGQRNGLWINWYANGQLEFKGKYFNNQKQGDWSFWYENGNLKEKGQYLGYLKHSYWTFWYENGNLKEEGLFNKEIKEGEWKYYNENGKLIAYGKYENGTGKSWYVDGTLRSEEFYVNGRKKGLWKEWYPNGQIKSEIEYRDDRIIDNVSEWYANGQKKHQILYQKGRTEQIETRWYENGTIEFENKNFGLQKDTVKQYFSNGNLKTIYLKRNPNAPLNTWYENGNLRSMRIFRAPRKDSIAAEWYENGQKKNQRKYIPEDSTFLIQAWFENGQQQLIGKEKEFPDLRCDGSEKKVGLWQYWNIEGNLIREEHYDK